MVTTTSWSSFAREAKLLAKEAPESTRFLIHWNHAAGTLMLQVATGSQSLKYKCTSTSTLNRVEALQRELTSIMATSSEAAATPPVPSAAGDTVTQQSEESVPVPEAGSDKAQNAGTGSQKKPRKKR